MKISLPWVCLAICCSFFVQSLLHQNNKIKLIDELDAKSKQIDQDQIRDLLYELQNLKNEKSIFSSASFAAGIIEGINKKDQYDKIWHSGYERGTENQMLSDSSKANKQIVQTSLEHP